jgi:hypothetical protein
MRVYKAKIIGFKKSKNKIGYYYPIFEYKNRYGEKRRYTRKKCMERTPFDQKKTYTICKKEFGTCELTEKQLAPITYFLAIRLVMSAISLIIPAYFYVTIFVNTIIVVGYKLWKLAKQCRLKLSRDQMDQINGKIIGYKKIHKNKWLGKSDLMFLPLIEYQYGNNHYVHVGPMCYKEEQKALNSTCNIYIHTRRQLIADEIELNMPLVNLSQISNTWKLSRLLIQSIGCDITAKIPMRAKTQQRQKIKIPKIVATEKDDSSSAPLQLYTYDYKMALG